MISVSRFDRQRFRVWITRVGHSLPGDWPGELESAVALMPAEEESFSASDAEAYVAGFNQAAHDAGQGVRAVAVPVELGYQGDLRPGQPIAAWPTAALRDANAGGKPRSK